MSGSWESICDEILIKCAYIFNSTFWLLKEDLIIILTNTLNLPVRQGKLSWVPLDQEWPTKRVSVYLCQSNRTLGQVSVSLSQPTNCKFSVFHLTVLSKEKNLFWEIVNSLRTGVGDLRGWKMLGMPSNHYLPFRELLNRWKERVLSTF